MKRFISKTLTVGLLTIFGLSSIYAQDAKKESISEERERLVKPYNPKENAEKKLAELVQKAQAEGTSNCPLCALGDNNNKTRIYKIAEMDADHVTAWSQGGATSLDNCEMLCKTHNRAKGNK